MTAILIAAPFFVIMLLQASALRIIGKDVRRIRRQQDIMSQQIKLLAVAADTTNELIKLDVEEIVTERVQEALEPDYVPDTVSYTVRDEAA